MSSPAEADIVIDLRFAVHRETAGAYMSYDAYTRRLGEQTEASFGPELSLVISNSRGMLWSEIDHQKRNNKTSNHEQELVKSADRLSHQLRSHVAALDLGTSAGKS